MLANLMSMTLPLRLTSGYPSRSISSLQIFHYHVGNRKQEERINCRQGCKREPLARIPMLNLFLAVAQFSGFVEGTTDISLAESGMAFVGPVAEFFMFSH